ncbi:hypothetical protein OIU85_008113 [Salix viminalis]|uniref:Uncharacterized protein n=1 Tax=Salix viminalis TaxID=40686 RepID=A0A9Q0PAD1_SALVM|nr:hypothetical protein OIU85_008113 [Salix viminalis]
MTATCIHSFHLLHLVSPPPPTHLLSTLFLQLCSPFCRKVYIQWPAIYMTMGLVSLMVSLKSKIRGLKMKKPYDKIEKSDSMRVEIRSRKAKKLIEETLKIADSPRSKTYAL